jgi:hypothetical protein
VENTLNHGLKCISKPHSTATTEQDYEQSRDLRAFIEGFSYGIDKTAFTFVRHSTGHSDYMLRSYVLCVLGAKSLQFRD